ncbi:MAG: glycosyl hydrolase 115 family protein [Planctomycetota bacterium]
MIKKFRLTSDVIIVATQKLAKPVLNAVAVFQADFKTIFGSTAALIESPSTYDRPVILIETDSNDRNLTGGFENFTIQVIEKHPLAANARQILHVRGTCMGLVRALYHISSRYLGIDPFWFWTGKTPSKKDCIEISPTEYSVYNSPFRYRGWFVNGEDCLLGWENEYPPSEKVWKPVLETLLRCGGNMVCAGTDLPRNSAHHALAGDMGLILTHHHAEPLGADMFARRYPDTKPIYIGNETLFEDIWIEAIERQKTHDVIWTLGFRGQGDRPFWTDAPDYDNSQKRGDLISRVINHQYQVLSKYIPSPVCCTNIYGEITELYRQGYLELPDGIIKIWADNGFGKMVSRRIGRDNPRISSLPEKDYPGPHGVYYHVNYHDLKHSNQLTELQSPYLIADEIRRCIEAGAEEYFIVNSGHIRPHVYTLDLISRIWADLTTDPDRHRLDFVANYYPDNQAKVLRCYEKYFELPVELADNTDEKAGEEFYHHSARQIITAWLKGQTIQSSEDLSILAGEKPFADQLNWYLSKAQEKLDQWQRLHNDGLDALQDLAGQQERSFKDSLLLFVTLHLTGSKGLIALCRAFNAFYTNNIMNAFLYASQAKWAYQNGLEAMKDCEYGKWHNYYRGDWLTNIKATVEMCASLQCYLRVTGDGPNLFGWYQKYLIRPEERGVKLAYINRKTLENDKLAEKLIAFLSKTKTPEFDILCNIHSI